MMRIAMLILVLAIAACQPEPEVPDTGLAGYDPDLIQREQAKCEKDGGRWGQGGLAGRFVCYRDTRDAGKSCTAEGDCEGLCLARSQSCAPVTPIFGCNDVLTRNGSVATLCID